MDAVMTDAAAKPEKQEDSFPVFLIKLVLFVALLRSLVFSPFTIPSESMLPRLLIGDYLLAVKWPYGYSSASLWPNIFPHFDGRVLGRAPARGDVVVFQAPANPEQNWIKRVIGLPGDTVQMVNGQLVLNGKPVPKVGMPDFVIPISANMAEAAEKEGKNPCVYPELQVRLPDGQAACRYHRFKETVPDGKGGEVSYEVLDMGITPQDNTQPVVVPEGTVFAMGDNRDNSEDSRFPVERSGVGMLPQENLVGKAVVVLWSTDGTASWIKPWTWFTACRWGRIGGTL